MMVDEVDPLCGVCHKPQSWHERDTVQHEFNSFGKLVSKKRESETRSIQTQRGDPVVRLALIRKGLLTVEDIEEVERELKALGVVYAGTVTRGSREDSDDNSA
jgi:hypothetical protein